MSPMNPYLPDLGFQVDDRVVVVHGDDIGMCHTTLRYAGDLRDVAHPDKLVNRRSILMTSVGTSVRGHFV